MNDSISYDGLQILYEDNHIIAINKANNEIVQGDKTGDICLADRVKAYIKEKCQKPGGVYLAIVHRIDRPVSGVVIFARTSKGASRLSQMFANKQIKKTYWAITSERPPKVEDELHHYMAKNEEKNRGLVSDRPRTGYKEAILSYRLIASTQNLNLLEVNLQTGRHHQIRAQLARIGCPIRGDLKYGAKRSNEGGGINLHARSVEFTHPVTGELIRIVAPVPNDNVWKALGAE